LDKTLTARVVSGDISGGDQLGVLDQKGLALVHNPADPSAFTFLSQSLVVP
jgi:hypothetical protein